VERDNQCYSQYQLFFFLLGTSVSIPNPAQLQFSINNILIGPVFHQELATCNWQQFFPTGIRVPIPVQTISIVNLNTLAGGNDFALDDISFAPVSIKRIV